MLGLLTWCNLKIRAKILFIDYYCCNIIKDFELLGLYPILIPQKSYKLYTYKYKIKELFYIC